jgi:hypothetical protein
MEQYARLWEAVNSAETHVQSLMALDNLREFYRLCAEELQDIFA